MEWLDNLGNALRQSNKKLQGKQERLQEITASGQEMVQ